jgi:hypothetical protein
MNVLMFAGQHLVLRLLRRGGCMRLLKKLFRLVVIGTAGAIIVLALHALSTKGLPQWERDGVSYMRLPNGEVMGWKLLPKVRKDTVATIVEVGTRP